MRSANSEKNKRRVLAVVAVAVAVAAVVGGVLCLTSLIDRKLNEGAEQQVATFTEQAAAGVSDRMFMVQDVIQAFTVQSSDPALVVPALKELKDRMGFQCVAFAGLDGTGLDAEGRPFNAAQFDSVGTSIVAGDLSYSTTFANDQGVRVRLAEKPLYVDGSLVGTLYAQVPLSLFTMPGSVDMFDGRGYFIVFEAGSGEILVPPAEPTKTAISNDSTLYTFLDEASRYVATESDGMADGLLAMQAQQGSDLSGLRDVVASDASGLMTASVDGRASYVCVSPVGSGYWYACSVVPVENVRAEAEVVTTTFEAVFGIVLVCLLLVGLLLFGTYRRRVRERNVNMMSQLYHALSDSMDLAVNLYSPADRSVTPIVAKAASIIGYPLGEFLNDPQLAVHIGLSPEGTQLFDRVRAGAVRDIEKGEFSFRPAGTGKLCWVSYSVSPLSFEGKSQLLVVLRDSTPEKEIQLSMKEAMDTAEAANQAKSEFLSRMSHEIRTPMNVIIGMLQIAQANVDDCGKLRACLGKIDLASDHLLGLINDVLDLSKIENEKMTLASKPFLLRDILNQVTGVIKAQCEQRRQTFEAWVAPDVEDAYVGDTVRVKQLLVNLLSNSVKYTPEGGFVRLETSVLPDTVAGYRQVMFVVSDNGIGMAQEFVGHLFEPFAMEGRSREQGTGLGMSIVKNIVSLMGGTVSVDSAVGKGTTFRVMVSLRIARDDERAQLEAGQAPDDAELFSDARPSLAYDLAAHGGCRFQAPDCASDGAAANQKAADACGLEGLRVLVAEDNELNAEIAYELLTAAGLVVERAADGEEASERFAASPVGYYDVVLMDVQMPRLNGYDATRRIRALDREDACSVPIIAMSANAFAEDVSASLASGMNAHLSKPIEVQRVLAAIAHELPGK